MYKYGRETLLTIENKSFNGRDMDIDFQVPFSNEEEPDITEISLWNPNSETMSLLYPGASVNLSAGYTDDTGTLLLGVLRTWETVDHITDKELKMFLVDGSNRWMEQRVSLAFRSGLKASQVLGRLLDYFNMEVGPIILNDDVLYKQGKIFNTTLYNAITEVVSDSKSKVYIKQGTIYIRPDSQGSLIGFNLSPSTGLVGSPVKEDREVTVDEVTTTKTYWKLDCLLNHRLTVGTIIHVESKTLKSKCIIVSGEHKSDFITSLEVQTV